MNEKRRSLASLDLLRGFEAAARNLSFTRAAEELFVAQSAMSRQVKTIEDYLGVALFARRRRALQLTEAGHELYRATAQALRYDQSDGVAPWLSWCVWLETMQLSGLKPAGSIRFGQYDQVIYAAVDGQGVALGAPAPWSKSSSGRAG